MGISKFSCEDLSLPELRERLEDIRNDPTPPLVALLGENNNLLGIGAVTQVGDGTVTLEVRILTLPLVEFTVSLCCVCSIVAAPTLDALQRLLQLLGITPTP
jgi:hypothetical protein